jgi:hypothetical protein
MDGQAARLLESMGVILEPTAETKLAEGLPVIRDALARAGDDMTAAEKRDFAGALATLEKLHQRSGSRATGTTGGTGGTGAA